MKLLVVALTVTALGMIAFQNCSRMKPYSSEQGSIRRLSAGFNEGLTGSNILPMRVGGCGPEAMPNSNCVSVTLCVPGTSNCQTIDNIIVSTGNSGFRVYASALHLPLVKIQASPAKSLIECEPYYVSWGPVVMGEVRLGQEPAVQLPVQIMDYDYPGRPQHCDSMQAREIAGYNGILGLGSGVYDCGKDCSEFAGGKIYFSCDSSGCTPTAAPLEQQVSNPVAKLPVNNNGIAISLPAVPPEGLNSVEGYLILGIGTQTNNYPAQNLNVLPTDINGNFAAMYYDVKFPSYIESFIQFNYFAGDADPNTPLLKCASSDVYCPTSPLSYEVTQVGVGGVAKSQVRIEVGDYLKQVQSFNPNPNNNYGPNGAFNNIAAFQASYTIWGTPFLLGKTTWFAIHKRDTPLGRGPYVAY